MLKKTYIAPFIYQSVCFYYSLRKAEKHESSQSHICDRKNVWMRHQPEICNFCITGDCKLFQKNHTMKEIWIVIQISLISAVLWFSRIYLFIEVVIHIYGICVWVALLVGIVRVNWVIKPSVLEMKLQLLDSLITVNTKKKSKKGYKGKMVGHWKSQISILGALIMSLTMTLH